MITDQPLKNNIIVGDWFMIVCLDGYEPELAPLVIEAVEEVYDSETVACVLEVMAGMARMGNSVN